jgi:hypothetical protein
MLDTGGARALHIGHAITGVFLFGAIGATLVLPNTPLTHNRNRPVTLRSQKTSYNNMTPPALRAIRT